MRRGVARTAAAIGSVIVATTGAIVASWYIWSPAMTLEAMADAAARRDAVAVSSHMDMPALRADMRRVVQENLRRNIPSGRVVLDHRAITEILVGRIIDGVFSPRGTGRILDEQRDPELSRQALSYRISLDGPNRFTAHIQAPMRIDLRFTRHGARWMLSSIRNPPAATPNRGQTYADIPAIRHGEST